MGIGADGIKDQSAVKGAVFLAFPQESFGEGKDPIQTQAVEILRKPCGLIFEEGGIL